MSPSLERSRDIPLLTTARLRLRAHRPDDLADCIMLWSDAEVTRHIGGRPFEPEEVWSLLLRYAGHWSVLGFGYWVIEDRETGRFLGEAGFADYRRAVEPSLGGAPEAGWALLPAAQGAGRATEAVAAILAWGERHLPSPRTVCLIHPDNLASARVAARFGYREFARTTYRSRPTVLYER